MTKTHLSVSEEAFVLLPVAMLLLRAFGPRWFNGIWAASLVALFGWVLANVCIYFSFEDACQTLETYGVHPPQNIIENCTSDGAARVFGVLFGGLCALIYYAPFALIYEIALWTWRLYLKRRAVI